MKNWIYYKDKPPVNMGRVDVMERIGMSILFYNNGYELNNPLAQWSFDCNTERDLVYETIKGQMTEIKLDYHPDLEDY